MGAVPASTSPAPSGQIPHQATSRITSVNAIASLGVIRVVTLNQKPILVVCDDPLTANELATRITEACGDIVYASNKLEVLKLLKQFRFAAAVLTSLVHAHAIADTLKLNGVPLCVLENAASATVAAPADGVVVVADVDLVVLALGALVQRNKGKDQPRRGPSDLS